MSSLKQTALAFATGATLGAATLWVAMKWKRRKLLTNDASNGSAATSGSAAVSVQMAHLRATSQPCSGNGCVVADFDTDVVLSEQFTRNVQFFGIEGQKKISESLVVVVGLGGVGSHAAHLLLRSGVGRLRLVDFDQVSLSSLNRHCLATRADVGIPKATCLQRHFADIVPEASVEALVEMYTGETEDLVLSGRPDYVIDAIDNVDTKIKLLAACHTRGIPVLCCAGAGAKADPTRLRLADVSQCAGDPLARAVRFRLRRDHGIKCGIEVLLSTERPRCGLTFAGEDGADLRDYETIPNFRIRTIPVLGTTPAMFGMAAAGQVLCNLAGAPIDPTPVHRVPAKAINTQYDRLEAREWERHGVSPEELGVDRQEVEVLIREVWQGASARTPAGKLPRDEKALTKGLGELALTRWDPARPGTVDNLVLLTQEEADAHDEALGAGSGVREKGEEESEGQGDTGARLAALEAAAPEFAARVKAGLARAQRQFINAYY